MIEIHVRVENIIVCLLCGSDSDSDVGLSTCWGEAALAFDVLSRLNRESLNTME